MPNSYFEIRGLQNVTWHNFQFLFSDFHFSPLMARTCQAYAGSQLDLYLHHERPCLEMRMHRSLTGYTSMKRENALKEYYGIGVEEKI
jgi:hypothetical protein